MLKQLISSIITLLLLALYYLMDEASYLMNQDVGCGLPQGNKVLTQNKVPTKHDYVLPKLKYIENQDENFTPLNIRDDYMES